MYCGNCKYFQALPNEGATRTGFCTAPVPEGFKIEMRYTLSENSRLKCQCYQRNPSVVLQPADGSHSDED